MYCGIVPAGTGTVIHLRRPIFHDVGFATGGPSDSADIAAQSPERRPQALVRGIGKLNAGFENAVLEVLFVLRIHAPRDPCAIHVSWLDYQVAAAVYVNRRGRCAEGCGALRRIVRVSRRSAV